MECHQNSSNTIDYHGKPLNTITYHWIQCIHQTLPPAHLWKEEIYCRSVSVKTTRKKNFLKNSKKKSEQILKKKSLEDKFLEKIQTKKFRTKFKKNHKKSPQTQIYIFLFLGDFLDLLAFFCIYSWFFWISLIVV